MLHISSVAYLGFGKGGHGERAEREPITGVWGRKQSPWSESQGAKPPPPWSWNSFCFWTFNGSRKFAHFFLKFGNAENHSVISDAISHGDFNRILYRYEKKEPNIVEFCNSCWKTAKKRTF